jgi:deoxyadenosine/deoxycytidine kinase
VANLFEQPRFIAVEGPIRAGKSTLAQILSETLHARRIIEPEDNPFLMRRFEQQRELEDFTTPIVADYLFEKDKLFAYINLNDAELDLYNRYYQMFRADLPTPELVIYLQASPEALKQRIRRKGIPGERAISDKYIEQVAAAYEHFFFHYSSSDLLVVNTSDIDFVNNNRDLQLLLKRLAEPVHGTQYFLPLG